MERYDGVNVCKNSDGRFVKYEDYQELTASLNSQITDTALAEVKCEELQAQVKAVRGVYMDFAAAVSTMPPDSQARKTGVAWMRLFEEALND